MGTPRSTKPFGVYHWDTFEPPGDDTSLVSEADTLAEARTWVSRHYAGRLRSNGADRVQIVHWSGSTGRVVAEYRVG